MVNGYRNDVLMIVRKALMPSVIYTALIVFLIQLSGSTHAQNAAGGFGVGSGFGREIGINLDRVNQVKAEIAAGVYNRPCTPAEHDRTKWHSIVNTELKCYYDHTHIDDPNYVNDIFGPPGTWFNMPGQEISYPWQTFKAATRNEPNTAYAGQLENDLKHEGYIWLVRRDQPCPNGNCVTDFRIQTHAIMGAHDMPVRFHSYSIEARVCLDKARPETCGIMRYGGWMDMGRLFTTQPNDLRCSHDVRDVPIPLPADSLYFPLQRVSERDEIRCHPNVSTLPAYPPSRPLAEWWGHGGGETRFQIRSYDPIGNVNPADPSKWHFFCRPDDMSCRYDGSIFSIFVGYVLQVPEFVAGTNQRIRVDQNRDGRTDFKGFVSRWGGYNASCTASGLDCIPYHYDNIALNLFQNKEARYFHTSCDRNCNPLDYDWSPAGQRWINWFYRYADGHHGTATPTPSASATAVPTGMASATATTQLPSATSTVQSPSATATQSSSAGALNVSVDPASAPVGQTVQVKISLANIQNVYGLQTTCRVDPAVLAGTVRGDGDIFNANNGFFVDNGFKSDGNWTVGASRLKPSPAFSGSGLAYVMNYTVLSAGSTQVTCSALAVDADGRDIKLTITNTTFNGSPASTPTPGSTATPLPPTMTATAVPPTVTPSPIPTQQDFSTIAGKMAFQNHPDVDGDGQQDNDNITVQLVTPNGDVIASVTTGKDGAYTFSDVPTGTYGVTAAARHHLRVGKVVAVSAGVPVNLETITLPGGDTNNDGTIDLLDAGLIGANFDLEVGFAPADADVNMDGRVDIRDLAIIGGNYGLVAPVIIS